MHLMEAFTTLYECTRGELHRRRLLEVIGLLCGRLLHPVHGTGVPQFTVDWQPAPQIKFDVVWGWDRFAESGQKAEARDNTSYGHNAELAWLMNHAAQVVAMLDGHILFGRPEYLEAYGNVQRFVMDKVVNHGQSARRLRRIIGAP